VFLIAALALVLSLAPKASAETSTIDQSCASGIASNMGLAGVDLSQSFKPALNRLNKVSVYLGKAGSMIVRISNSSGEFITSGILAGPGAGVSDQWMNFNFSAVEVTPGQTYYVHLVGSAGISAVWFYRDNSCYANGTGYKNGATINRDFGFATYGYNQTSGGNSNTNGSSGTTNSNTNSSGITLGTAPSTNTTSDIGSPTDVKAKNQSTKTELKTKIEWTKSSTDEIDGYKVYRKNGGSEYGLAAQTTKDILNATDTNLTDKTEYTYMVRAYKGDEESLNSNEATVTAKKSTLKGITLTAFENPISWTHPLVIAFFVLAFLAILFFLGWYIRDLRKAKVVKTEDPTKPAI